MTKVILFVVAVAFAWGGVIYGAEQVVGQLGGWMTLIGTLGGLCLGMGAWFYGADRWLDW
jgi:hypothetical protein